MNQLRQSLRPLGLLGLLCVVPGLAGCPGGDGRKAVLVTPVAPAGLSVAIVRFLMEATLADKSAAEGPQVIDAGKSPFTLVLPAGSSGHLTVEIKAAGDGSLLVARGHAEIEIGEETSYELPVPLEAHPCPTGGFCYDRTTSRAVDLRAVFSQGEDDVWAVGARGTALHFDGFAWEIVDSGTQVDLYGVWGSGEGDVRFVGDGGTIIQPGQRAETTDSGAPLNGIFGFAADDIWAVGGRGTVLRWDGSHWSHTGTEGMQVYAGVWGTSSSDLWIVGERGLITHWDGSFFTLDSSAGTSVDLHAVTGTGTNDAWIAGDQGVLLHWAGDMWLAKPSGVTQSLYGLHAKKELWVAGQDGILLHGGTAGLSRASLPSAIPTLYAIRSDGEDAQFAVGASGTIVRAQAGKWTVVHQVAMTSSLLPPRTGADR